MTDDLHLWSQADAIALCIRIEAVCPDCGCHVALTGGTLYNTGLRKDCDILFYRIRQWDCIDEERLFAALESIGIFKKSGFGWCHKAEYEGKAIDIFFPEEQGDHYPEQPSIGPVDDDPLF